MYPTKPLWEICDLYQPKTISTKEMIEDGKYSVFWANWIIWKYDKYNHENEEILITCRWATCWAINISEKFSWINGNAMVAHIKNDSELYFLYLFYALKNLDFRKIISGSAQPQITRQWLVNIQISLPPLWVQQKIVEKLDKIFAKIDKNISLTKQNIANIDEENNAILEKIFTKCEEEFWVEKFSEILEICEYWSSEKSFDYLENWVSVLRMGNIQNWKIDFSDLKFCPKDSKNLPKLFLKKYDLLFNRTNSWELVWKTWIFEWNDDEISFAWYLIRLRFFKNKALQKFWNYFLNSQGFRKNQLEKQIDQTAGQANFSASKLKTCKIPLPPLPKQQEIVTYLDNIFAKNSELKNFYEKNLKNLEELRQSILKQAFEDENFIK